MTFNKKMGSLNSILFIILSINLFQFVFHHPVASTDVLIPGDQVNTNYSSSLVSASGNFTLGFFQFVSSNSTYLGIGYNFNNHIVWVANRNMPILGVEDGVVLKIEDSGTLKVVNGSGITLFNIFYNQTGSGNKTRAVLEDSGNFVVYDELNRTLWQSFDHPTDILISGMKLGYNLTTKQNWTLTSWLSDEVPASGAFTLSLERYQNSPQLLIYRRGVLYWASGPWKNGTFQFLDSFYRSIGLPSYYLSLISDPSGMSVTFQTNDNLLRLNPDGQFDDGRVPINGEAKFCYGYPSDDGCVVSTLPNCRGQSDSFQWKIGNWSGGPSISDDNSSINQNECMEKCWNKCNCVGFIPFSDGVGCTTWVNNSKYMQFIEDPSGTEHQYVLVSQKSLKTTASASAPVPAAAALVPADYSGSAVDYGFSRVALAFILIAIVPTSILLLCWCCVMIRRRRRRRREAQEKKRRDDIIHQLIGSDSFNYGDELEKDIKDAPNVKVFSLKAILTATNNFSNENKLGQGGYGPVYKGILPDGREIAVKKLSKTSGQGIGEFKNELILITKLQHTNLVRLYGCCIHPEEKMLVYEFMPNKSLDFFLFVADKKEKIDWQIRFNIIEGVAQGMLYLHKYSRMKVIHRDMKVSNVLLDENMNPKIADFGMARIFQHNVTEAMTNRVVGTYGYMAPEYAMEGSFSIKSDVFSFGVLILEIVSGKKNSTFYNLDRPLNLIGYAWELWKRQRALELKDETLGESFDVKQLLRAIHVGLLCVQEDANDRPTMSEVISMLNNEIVDLPNPKKPAFFTGRQVVGTRSTDYLLDEIVPVSVNGLTITTLEAR